MRVLCEKEMYIDTLNKQTARERCEELLLIHNLIPCQHWESKDLLAEMDIKRKFLNKWDVSAYAVTPSDNSMIGICVAFFDILQGARSLYIHRLAVLESKRRQGVASALIANSLNHASGLLGRKEFQYFLKTQYKNGEAVLSREEQAIDFYDAIGMKVAERIESVDKLEFLLTGSSVDFFEKNIGAGEVECF